MGEPVRILDLVQSYARQVAVPVTVKYTGLRPGEKINEALFGSGDADVMPTTHPSISAVVARPVGSEFGSRLSALELAAESNDAAVVMRELQRIVPEYAPSAPVPAARSATVHPLGAPYPDGF
jgi:FlaA1/EpsC-like NDP-sugar epimerase